jgi:hypothetical protein
MIHLMSTDGSMALCCHQAASHLPGDDQVTRRPERATCTGPALRMSQRWWCLTRILDGVTHDSGTGVMPRQRCRGCGGQFVTEQGRWGVFEYTTTGIYRLESAEEHYLHHHMAQKLCDRENKAGASWVVRWIPESAFRQGRAA